MPVNDSVDQWGFDAFSLCQGGGEERVANAIFSDLLSMRSPASCMDRRTSNASALVVEPVTGSTRFTHGDF